MDPHARSIRVGTAGIEPLLAEPGDGVLEN
jgi:hypothetical protein